MMKLDTALSGGATHQDRRPRAVREPAILRHGSLWLLTIAIMSVPLLAQDGQWWGAAANVLLSVVLCLVGVWLGAMLAGALNQMR